MAQTFIVTGGAGLIGCNIVAGLNRQGHSDITIVDNLNHEAKQANLDSVNFDTYMDRTEFRKHFLAGKQPPVTTVFHMGACSSTTETDEHHGE